MSVVLRLLGMALTAAVAENVLFSRALCLEDGIDDEISPAAIWEYSKMVLQLSLLAAVGGWTADYLISRFWVMPKFLRPPVYLAFYILLFALLHLMLNKIPAYRKKKGRILRLHTLLAFGYIPIATLFVIGFGTHTFLEAVCYGLGVAVGYYLAMMLAYIMKERLVFCRVPKSFAGAPVMLLYIGLISLALFGLVGHPMAV